MRTALEDVASAAEGIADDQRLVARRARQMQRRRDAGWSWAQILDWEPEPKILDLLRRSGRRLSEALGELAQAMASGLSSEGESHRQVARRLAVSHQRVTTMLKGDRHRPDRDLATPARH